MSPSELESKKQSAIERIDCLNQLQVYPPRNRLDPEAWLNNFHPSEIPYALVLMRGLLFFNASSLERLFIGSINRLVSKIVSPELSCDQQAQQWNKFFSSAYFTRIPGELASEADSGFIFLRLVRDIFKIPENHILSPEAAFASAKNHNDVDVIFVDDFIGSGHQMLENLESPRGGDGATTFKELAAVSSRQRFYCCTAICAESGYRLLHRECPQLTVVSQHVLSDRYNVRSPDYFVPHGVPDFTVKIEEISMRAGILRNGVWGHKDLGLSVAFEHGIPDSTIPLLSHRSDTWMPLLKAH